ncbi:putative urea ABC transporter substrate-binding protein [Thiomicrorhabdus heinhorstiae]|uniref:ABC transporter substrate-binding protein n=1 Tax=Thiomicrorhabdus heinhorstiae TaxID=2748010 RepID=A0ABS0BXM1_9GAMM|nr:putative urea ABC transporter substrate-binding protein [Thiomicrorhabdus heinhorstiae]MBF6058548.1 ABC transporter substrate-binding protein [Thiomicrorhabdus heinhorstiae]
MFLFKKRLLRLLAATFLLSMAAVSYAKDKYTIAWTIYAGSMPLAYAQDSGILQKWGDRYGFDLEAVQLNDYIEAQTQFTAGTFDAVIAISLDALTIPAASGIDTTAVMPLSTSAGSDGIIICGKNKTLKDLQGKRVNLVELSGSHYMLIRALETIGLSEKDVTVVNTSDADIAAIFEDPNSEVVATWKPQLSEILSQYPDSTLVFDSADIYGEIVDVMAVKTEALKHKPELGKAIAGAWYEALSIMQDIQNPKHSEMMAYMSKALHTDEQGLDNQLKTIDFFIPEKAEKFVTSAEYPSKLKEMTQFAFEHGLLGEGASSADFIGIETGDHQIVGDRNNVKLRFPTTWLEPLQ